MAAERDEHPVVEVPRDDAHGGPARPSGGPGALARQSHRLALGEQPARAVEAALPLGVGELAARACSRDDATVGRRHHRRPVEEADDLLAEVVERAAREHDLHEGAVGVLEPAQHRRLVLEDRAQHLGREGAEAALGHLDERQADARGRLDEQPVCRRVGSRDDQPRRSGVVQGLDDRGRSRARWSRRQRGNSGTGGTGWCPWRDAASASTRQCARPRRPGVGPLVSEVRLRAWRSGRVLSTVASRPIGRCRHGALGRCGEAGDEAERDARDLGDRSGGAAGRGRGWQVTIATGRIVGNFHHERTLPSVDTVTTRRPTVVDAGARSGRAGRHVTDAVAGAERQREAARDGREARDRPAGCRRVTARGRRRLGWRHSAPGAGSLRDLRLRRARSPRPRARPARLRRAAPAHRPAARGALGGSVLGRRAGRRGGRRGRAGPAAGARDRRRASRPAVARACHELAADPGRRGPSPRPRGARRPHPRPHDDRPRGSPPRRGRAGSRGRRPRAHPERRRRPVRRAARARIGRAPRRGAGARRAAGAARAGARPHDEPLGRARRRRRVGVCRARRRAPRHPPGRAGAGAGAGSAGGATARDTQAVAGGCRCGPVRRPATRPDGIRPRVGRGARHRAHVGARPALRRRREPCSPWPARSTPSPTTPPPREPTVPDHVERRTGSLRRLRQPHAGVACRGDRTGRRGGAGRDGDGAQPRRDPRHGLRRARGVAQRPARRRARQRRGGSPRRWRSSRRR